MCFNWVVTYYDMTFDSDIYDYIEYIPYVTLFSCKILQIYKSTLNKRINILCLYEIHLRVSIKTTNED